MNIWEIVTINDLIKILKEQEKRFVIVAITLESTPKPITKALKKFLKHYAKLYENLTFLYYCANQKDLGRISLLSKNTDEYPYVYHIFDTSNIFVSVNRANENTIYEAFNAVEEYYKKDLLAFLAEKNNKDNLVNLVDLEKSNSVNLEKNKDNSKDNSKDKSKIVIQNMNNNMDDDDDNNNRDDNRDNNRALEHQKLLDKLMVFEDKKKDFSIKILGDIQQRKKDEIKKINS